MKPHSSLPKIGVCLINYHQPGLTLMCLDSLTKQTYPNLHLYLLDNHTSGEFEPHQLSRYKNLTYLKSKSNFGFAAGNNLLINKALNQACLYIVLLNNDTTADPRFINQLHQALKDNPQAGLAGCAIVYQKTPDKIWFAGGKLYNPWMLTRHSLMNRSIHKLNNKPHYTRSDWITGCAMMIPKSTIDQIGPLDESFFAYLEDVDFSVRVIKSGKLCMVVNRPLVKHAVSASVGSVGNNHFTGPKIVLQAKNTTRIIKKHYPSVAIILIPINLICQVLIYLIQRRITLSQSLLFLRSGLSANFYGISSIKNTGKS